MKESTEQSAMGKIRISDEAVATMASTAALKVEGVATMSGGLVDNLAEMVGKRSTDKGVIVRMGPNEVSIDVAVLVEFGVDIPSVALKVQERVRDTVEKMTGLTVRDVNVTVNGVVTTKSK